MARATPGTVVMIAPSPAATARVSAPMPTAVPTTCGSVRRKPKAAPEAISRMLFGPGVPALMIENATSAASCSTSRCSRGPLPRSCTILRWRGRPPRRRSPPGNRPFRVFARCSTATSSSTRIRRTPMTRGRCSSSMPVRSATTSIGRSVAPTRRWCRFSRRSSSMTAGRQRPEATGRVSSISSPR